MKEQSGTPSKPNYQSAPKFTFPKEQRILRSADFRKVYQEGIRMTSQYFVAFCLRLMGEVQPSRIGFTVPRALGKAVQRNRIRRRMREAVRHQAQDLGPNWCVVFNPRRSSADAPFDELKREVERIFSRCKGR